MSSALTVIVLGHVLLGSVPNNLPNEPSSVLVSNITESLYNVIRQPDYTYIPGIGSHKVHKQAKTWDDARLICQGEGGDLAVINSKAEAIIVGQLVAISQPHIGSAYDDLALIGFNDRENEGVYKTINGQTLSEAGYEEWSEGEPNNGGPNTSQQDDCGGIEVTAGLLFDTNCVRQYAFVCELPDPVVKGMMAAV